MKTKIGFQDRLSLNAGQKYCRMLQEHSAIFSTFIKLPYVTMIKIFVLSICEWPLKTGFTVKQFILVNSIANIAHSVSYLPVFP